MISRFIRHERGATVIEYALIAALTALAIITGAGAQGNSINAKFKAIGSTVNQRVVMPIHCVAAG
ncbi:MULTISPECIES: Flp family type IVb pilin [unclassified Mesorhizobium]|uniref:Flp family type IVb pilin n=1 Tax=unclassified Mesorhizobium TaxID=325217 RepID=UPI001FE11557|nr:MULTISPECIES: Flp family type IVb pilin [unclassified Mesorhizobium]